jgi:hypothetical protein
LLQRSSQGARRQRAPSTRCCDCQGGAWPGSACDCSLLPRVRAPATHTSASVWRTSHACSHTRHRPPQGVQRQDSRLQGRAPARAHKGACVCACVHGALRAGCRQRACLCSRRGRRPALLPLARAPARCTSHAMAGHTFCAMWSSRRSPRSCNSQSVTRCRRRRRRARRCTRTRATTGSLRVRPPRGTSSRQRASRAARTAPGTRAWRPSA